MGLFGKIFEKKSCDLCGGEIGLLGNRKLEDGNCCKACAKKLSPWFDERRHSTVEQIRQQLQYREENKQAAAAFNKTRIYGNGYQILMIDEKAGKFCVCGKNDLPDENPDIVDISAITSFEMVTDEHQTEIYRQDKDGNNVSYNPRRYKYSYDFYYEIHVNHPYFDEMRFQLNSNTVEMREMSQSPIRNIGQKSTFSVLGTLGMGQSSTLKNPEYDRYIKMGEEITDKLNELRDGGTGKAEASKQEQTGEAQNENEATGSAAQASSSVSSEAVSEWTCEFCGTVNTGKFCTGCGSPKS